MTEKPLYLEDNYAKEFEAEVKEVNKEKFIVLDNTLFYPASGGQPYDTGTITTESGTEYKVVYVGKFNNQISHEVDNPGLKPGDKIKGKLDWDRRYKLMRYHTAAHVLSEVIHKKTGAKITGNQLDLEKGRIDLDLENFDREAIHQYGDEANQIIKKELEVKKTFMSAEEAFKDPDLFSLKNALPPDIKELRIVEVDGYDKKACGGTHVNNIKEIGEIEILKADNKGKNNRRIYFKIKP